MPKTLRQSAPEQALLTLLVGSAIGAFASSQKALPAWLLLVPCAVSLVKGIERLRPGLASLVRFAAWGFLGGTVLLGLTFVTYPVFSDQTHRALILAFGYALASLATLFLLGGKVWRPATTLFPATLGTLVVGAFNPAGAVEAPLASAGASIFAYLWVSGRAAPPAQEVARRAVAGRRPSLRVVLSALGIFFIAWAVIRFLPWAQVKVEQAGTRIFFSPATHYSSLPLDSRLGDLEQLKLSNKLVMRVWSSRAQKLRGRIFTRFDGQTWHARQPIKETLSPAPGNFSPDLDDWLEGISGDDFIVSGHDPREASAADAIRSRIVQKSSEGGLLVAPGNKLLVRLAASSLRLDTFEGLVPVMTSSFEIYGVVNRRQDDIVQGGNASPQLVSECLALPEDTDPRLKQLASRLASEAGSPEERLGHTVRYVQNACRYSLEVGKFHSRQPVAEFLFDKKQGYCEYFASAAALLLRLEGVPSRYVTGFNVQDGNLQGGHYVVRDSDAHAWVEAYLPGKGWVEADPTPEAEYDALHADLKGGWLDDATEWFMAELAEIAVHIREGGWTAAIGWLGRELKPMLRNWFVKKLGLTLLAVALALAAVIFFKRRKTKKAIPRPEREARRERSTVPPELAELMARLDRLWAGRGFLRPASRAPLEHLAGIPPENISPAFRDLSRQVVECVYRGYFGGARPDAAETQALRRALDEVMAG